MSKFIPDEVNRQEEPWQLLFEKDSNYLKAKQASFQKFRKQYLAKPTWQEKLWSFLETNLFWLYQPRVVLSAVSVLSLTCLVLFIILQRQQTSSPKAPAQVLSTTNQISSSTPKLQFTSLIPDTQNSVSSIDECDLGIRFPRQVRNMEVEIKETVQTKPNQQNPIPNEQVILQVKRTQNSNSLQSKKLFYPVTVSCYKLTDRDKLLATKNLSYRFENWTKERLQEETGWYLTQSELQNILSYQLETKISNQPLVHREILFDYQDKVYQISFAETKDSDKQSNPKQVNSSQDLILKSGQLAIDKQPFEALSKVRQVQANSFLSAQTNLLAKTETQLELVTNLNVGATTLSNSSSALSQDLESSPKEKSDNSNLLEIATINFRDLQFQFNSVAQNTVDTPLKVSSNLVQPLQANRDYSVAVLDFCDLAVSFRTQSLQKGNLQDMDALVIQQFKPFKIVFSSQFLKNQSGTKARSILEIECSTQNLPKNSNRLKKEIETVIPYFLDGANLQEFENYQTFLAYNEAETRLDLSQKQYRAALGENLVWMSTFNYQNKYYRISLYLFDQDPNLVSQILPDVQIQINSLAPSIPNVFYLND